ncbi:MAG: Cof-type HAD-IIB family hydrolase [Treponema sp.]|jgi:Cof subfamily protein (haloacid dehalogenase superfamily)|nr:Cof-type HAD-IIB family hydrolase [Treponema sp.]
MNIDAIAFDLDGTTLNSRKEISAANRNALKNALAAGIQLIPCTGRSLSFLADALIDLFNELGFGAFPYVITDNGAQVYALPTRQLLMTKNLSEQTSLAVLAESRTYQAITHCSFGAEGGTDNKGAAWENGIGREMIASYSENWYGPIVDLEPLIRWNCGVVKFSIVFHKESEFKIARDTFSHWPELTLASGDVKSLEVMSRGIHKGETLRFVSEYSGIPMERIMTIGDNYNDMEMIRDAGWGVAMGNAVCELKEAADWITLTNDEDGLAAAIKKMLAARAP